MSEPIGALRAELSATAVQFEKDMARAARALGISKQAFTTLEHSAKLASLAIGAAVEVFAVAGAAAFAMTKVVANQGDELYKLSQRVGVSVEQLSSLKYAAELSDVSLEQLGNALGRLARNMDEADAGTKEAVEAFQRLGIAVKDVATGRLRSMDSVLGDLADRFSRMEDGAEKTALAIGVFGKAGAQLIPFLNQGREGLAAMQAEAEKLGITWRTEDAKAAEVFNDSLSTLWRSLQGLQKTVVTDLMPVFTELAKEMSDFVASDEMREWARELGEYIVNLARETKNLLQWFGLLPDTLEGKLAKVRQEIKDLRDKQGTSDVTDPLGGVFDNSARIAELEAEEQRLAAKLSAHFEKLRATMQSTSMDPRKPFVPGPAAPAAAKATGADPWKDALREQAQWTKDAAREELALIDKKLQKDEEARQLTLQGELNMITEAMRIRAEFLAWDTGLTDKELQKDEDARKLALQGELNMIEEAKRIRAEFLAWDTNETAKKAEALANITADEYKKIATNVATVFEPFARAFSGMVQGVLQGTQTLEEGFRRMGQNIAATLMESIIDNGLKEIAKALTQFASSMASSGGSGWAGIISALASAFGGARAAGGPVMAGSAYLVGEQGPELFVPRGAGKIIPNDDLGGGTTINIDARGAQRGVSNEVMQAIRLGMGQAVNISLARVQDQRRRGGMRGFDR